MTHRSILKTLRERAGFSQEQTAFLLGVSCVSIQNWEGGQYMRYPQKLSDLLDLYGANGAKRIYAFVSMYGDEQDMEYLRTNLKEKRNADKGTRSF